MHKLISLIILLTLFLSVCKTSTEPVPPEKKPPGYQEDIPWPSLADSPWPMYRHDPQSTGRSSYPGPSKGEIIATMDSIIIQSGVSIGYNSISLFNSYKWGIFGVNKTGSVVLNKNLSSQEIFTTPVISRDSLIILGLVTGKKFLALQFSGNIKWSIDLNSECWNIGINIDKEGNLYFIDNNSQLYSVNKTGNINWTLSNKAFNNGPNTVLTFSPDGNILYIPGKNPALFAMDVNSRKIKWSFGLSKLNAAPIVDSQGDVYLLTYTDSENINSPAFYSLNPAGKIRWQFNFAGKLARYSDNYIDPTIDQNGNLYLGTEDSLFSFDYFGNLRWKKNLSTIGSIINDANNYIYINSGGKIICLNSEGNIMWEIPTDGVEQASPAINESKQMFYPSFNKGLLIIN